ncbi:MAG: hypothetical protein EYC62_08650 [Alphaproteobacteria bacterium]|nr:MAG: hypothetical protein EYC62_08650 [Alphaproteobacteria bacterium]
MRVNEYGLPGSITPMQNYLITQAHRCFATIYDLANTYPEQELLGMLAEFETRPDPAAKKWPEPNTVQSAWLAVQYPKRGEPCTHHEQPEPFPHTEITTKFVQDVGLHLALSRLFDLMRYVQPGAKALTISPEMLRRALQVQIVP